MSICISNEILEASQLTPAEFLQEVSIHLFESGRLTVGYAAQMAQMDLMDFKALLKQRKIPLYTYDIEDFEMDLESLRALDRL